MHSITIGHDSPHFAAVVAILAGGKAPAAAPAASGKAADKTAKDAAPKEKTTEERSGGIAYDTLSAKVLELSKKAGRDEATNLLAEYTNAATGEKATKGKELEPEDYADFIEKADALIAEKEMG